MFQLLKRKASKRKETLDNLVKKIDLYPYLKDFERKSLYKEILTSELNSNLKKTLIAIYELKSKNFILAQKLTQKEKDEKVEKHQSKIEEKEEHNLQDLQNKVKENNKAFENEEISFSEWNNKNKKVLDTLNANSQKEFKQTETERKAKTAIEKVEGIRRAKVLKGLEKRFLLNDIKNKGNLYYSEVRAFYSGDFVNANGEIKDFLFEYDKEKEVFFLPINQSVEYSLDIVLKDDDFLIVIIDREL